MREIMLIVHFIGLAMGLGTSFAYMFLGKASSKMEPNEVLKFIRNISALSNMGHIGLTLSVISGGFLIVPYWNVITSIPLLMTKLLLVLILIIIVGIINIAAKRDQTDDSGKHIKLMHYLGVISFLSYVTIVVLAVYVFH